MRAGTQVRPAISGMAGDAPVQRSAPRVVAVHGIVPPHRYEQGEVTRALEEWLPLGARETADCTVQDVLRELVIPFGRCRINPAAEQVRAPTIAWLSGHGLLTTAAAVEQYDAMHFERLAAMAYPACDRAALQLISNVMGWFFLFDDQFDGILGTDPSATAAAVDAMTRCLDHPPSGADRAGPLGVAFRELWLTSAAQMSPSWRRRTRTSWIRYLRSYTTEATARRDGDSDLAAYLATRQDSIGIPPSVNLAEPLHQVELPPRLVGRPPLNRLMALTGQHVALVNDLFSAGKERACGETYNSVLIIQRGRQCDVASAARQVMDLIAAIHQEFQQLSAELATLLDRQATSQRERTAVAVHLACMTDWMHANLTWSRRTARYSDLGVSWASQQRPWSGLIDQAPAA